MQCPMGSMLNMSWPRFCSKRNCMKQSQTYLFWKNDYIVVNCCYKREKNGESVTGRTKQKKTGYSSCSRNKWNFSLQGKLDWKESGKSQQAEQPSPSDKPSEQQFGPLEDDDSDSSQNESNVPSFKCPPPPPPQVLNKSKNSLGRVVKMILNSGYLTSWKPWLTDQCRQNSLILMVSSVSAEVTSRAKNCYSRR